MTAVLNVLTGGLSIVTNAIPSFFSTRTTCSIKTPHFQLHSFAANRTKLDFPVPRAVRPLFLQLVLLNALRRRFWKGIDESYVARHHKISHSCFAPLYQFLTQKIFPFSHNDKC